MQYSGVALQKSIAHLLKHQKADCIGLLVGFKEANQVTVTDVIPLFHERVMACTTEIAFEMIESHL